MKKKIVLLTRKVLPKPLLRAVEDAYRISRVYAVSARYGNPARTLKVVAVTGTNGKTTTVNFINEILKESGKRTAMFSTAQIELAGKMRVNDYNATVTTTAQMQQFFKQAKKAKVDYVVMEFPSHALEQHKLDTVPVEIAIMTNLTQDHLDYHGTMENYAAAKLKLFKKEPKYIVLNNDDNWFNYFNDNAFSESEKISYGKGESADARISSVKLYRKGTEATVVIDHQTTLELTTALPGEFNAYNMVAAASAMYLIGVSLRDIQEGIANLEAIPGRFERVELGTPYDIIVDYAHTPDALEKLLDTAGSLTKRRVLLVFGSCGDRDKGKRPIMGVIAAKKADRIFLTDEESYSEDPAHIREQILSGITSVSGGEIKTTEIPDRRETLYL